MAATTALLAHPNQGPGELDELARIADEEVKHLEELIDDAVDAGRSGHGEYSSST